MNSSHQGSLAQANFETSQDKIILKKSNSFGGEGVRGKYCPNISGYIFGHGCFRRASDEGKLMHGTFNLTDLWEMFVFYALRDLSR